jgi:endonuclease/exonuclease/phosphatase family metal-dependent hydrolase
MILKVTSWNIWFGKHYHDIAKHLKNVDADVIGLQEVIQDLDGKHNTAENIAKELGYHWKYEETVQFPYEGRTISWGNAILSKHKILNTKLHDLTKGDERKTALEATLEIADKQLTIVSTHFTHTHQQASEVQEHEAKSLLSVVPNELAIVMGDFNALPDSKTIQIITERLHHTDKQLDPSWCMYIDGCEVCRIDQLTHRLDYIFATNDLKVHSFETDYSKGSDHLPISTTFEL